MEVIIQKDAAAASAIAARIVARQIWDKPKSVIGLATGETPLLLYKELIRIHAEGHLDFSGVVTFNLDEYVGLGPDHPRSYCHYMQTNFFDHVNIPENNIHIPKGQAGDIPALCRQYEQSIADSGGIDMQILGIGRDGHIAFNEPSSSLASRTRIKTLTEETRSENARFFESPSQVPHHVITMGVGTIMEARCCLLLAFGADKADAVAATVEGPLTAMIPASALQNHPAVKIVLDEAAASRLAQIEYYRWVYDHKPHWQRY